MEFLRKESIEVDEEVADVEVYVMNDAPTKKVESDPFMKMELKGLPSNLKRKVTRLQKAAAAADQTGKSKSVSPEQLATAYDVFQVITPPYNLDFLAKLYEMNASHNAAVTMKAVNIVGLGYHWIPTEQVKFELGVLQRGSQKAVVAKMDEFALEKIKLSAQLADLNDEMEFNELMTAIWVDVEALGNGYLEIGRNNKRSINYIGHIPGQTMRVRAKRDGFVQIVSNKYTYFRNYGDQDTADPTGQDDQPNEILHFKKYSPNSTYYGVPDIVAALPAALGDKFAREYNLDYFENKAVPRYAFILKGAKLSAKAEATLINYFKNELKGKHHGTLYIPLPAGFGQQVEAEFKQIEVGIQDSSFINYIKENRTEILMVHRVPPSKVGITHNANLAVSRDQDKTFKEQICAPEQRRVEKKIQKIFEEFTKNFVLKFLEADIIDADIKSRINDRYLRTQVLVPNDVLEELGKPTRPDGAKPLPFVKPGSTGGGAGSSSGGPSADGKQSANQGGGGSKNTSTGADDTGTRQPRGAAQSAGRTPKDDTGG